MALSFEPEQQDGTSNPIQLISTTIPAQIRPAFYLLLSFKTIREYGGKKGAKNFKNRQFCGHFQMYVKNLFDFGKSATFSRFEHMQIE